MADTATGQVVINMMFVMRKTLEYYANVKNYDADAKKPVSEDKGELARKALAMLEEL